MVEPSQKTENCNSYLQTSWHFRTIGLGTANYRAASRRLANEANSLGIFSSSSGYDEKFLKEMAPAFWNDHKEILKARFPGFGWWVWKPEFVKKSLERIPEGHGLLYCDSGNFINPNQQDVSTLASYMNLASLHGVVASNSQSFIEEDWSETTLMDLLEIPLYARKESQFMAGFILITNSKAGKQFVEHWSKLSCIDDHRYLIPIKPVSNVPTFYRTSYDQSIFSCLMKHYSLPSVFIGDKSTPGCVRAVRHRFGYKFNESKTPRFVFFKILSILSRVKLFLERRIFPVSLNTRPRNHLPINGRV